MFTQNLHGCAKIEARPYAHDGLEWTTFAFLDADGRTLVELTVFDRPDIVLGDVTLRRGAAEPGPVKAQQYAPVREGGAA